jgi:flavin reductase (DIM6/NTAB) family NADH-FMN oxidoreductase RutF
MRIDPAPMQPQDIYRLLTGVVVPRPIAWVTTQSATGIVNLAPFSCFTFVSSKPPMVGINVGLRNGEQKDTARNILESKNFIVNIADETMAEKIHLSGVAHPYDVSETTVLGLETVPGEKVSVPRLAMAPVSMECVLRHDIQFGTTGSTFLVGEVVMFHLRDGLCENNKVDTRALRPICRIGGPNYAALGEIYSMRNVADVATGPSDRVE